MNPNSSNNTVAEKRSYYIGAAVEFSFVDFAAAFEKFGISYVPNYSQCCVEVDLPNNYGLLFFDNSNNYCAHHNHIKEQLEQINPGYRLCQAIFDKSDADNMKIILATFEATKHNSNYVCFEPNNELYLINNQIISNPDVRDRKCSHVFNKKN